MPAPTALQRQPEKLAKALIPPPDEDDVELLIDGTHATVDDTVVTAPATKDPDGSMEIDEEGRPKFAPAKETEHHIKEWRRVPVPPHRMSPLKNAWTSIYPPLVENLGLQVKMDVKSKAVLIQTSPSTVDGGLQKGEDFLKAFTLGFAVEDAIALIRLDDLYIESFEIKDVKPLHGEHLSRAIGRVSGKDGKMKFAIENVSKTRIVIADQKISILGAYKNIRIAREMCLDIGISAAQGIRQATDDFFAEKGTVLKKIPARHDDI